MPFVTTAPLRAPKPEDGAHGKPGNGIVAEAILAGLFHGHAVKVPFHAEEPIEGIAPAHSEAGAARLGYGYIRVKGILGQGFHMVDIQTNQEVATAAGRGRVEDIVRPELPHPEDVPAGSIVKTTAIGVLFLAGHGGGIENEAELVVVGEVEVEVPPEVKATPLMSSEKLPATVFFISEVPNGKADTHLKPPVGLKTLGHETRGGQQGEDKVTNVHDSSKGSFRTKDREEFLWLSGYCN